MQKIVQINHPMHHLTASDRVPLALVRIPKNASSTLVAHPSFAFQKAFTPFADFGGRVVAAVREPEARFVSSIPETIKRFRLADPSQSLNAGGDVVVAPEIYRRLAELDLRNPARVIEVFLDLVSDGPFDGHHQPQVQFLLDESEQFQLDVELFDLRQIDSVVRRLEADFALGSPAIGKLNHRENELRPLRLRERLGLYKRRLKGAEPWNPRQYLQQRFSTEHPISRFAQSEKLPMDCYGFHWVEECLRRFYGALKEAYAASPATTRQRVAELYAADSQLFALVNRPDVLLVPCRKGSRLT